jgi:RimJ/RimL family protein N-acetyltransferase
VSRQTGLTPDTLRAAPRALNTARLRLEAPSVEHAQALADFLNASLPEWPFINWAKFTRDLAWAQQFCARGLQYVEDGENLIFNVFDPVSAACIGRIDLHSFDFEAPRCEIGYVGDPRVAGQGLLREATLAVVELGFALGLERIEAFSDARNERAVRFALGMGFEREGVVRHRERDPQGELCSQVLLARLR